MESQQATSTPKPIADAVQDMFKVQHAFDGLAGDDQERIAREGISWIALMLRKNRDYGSAVWQASLLAPELSPDSTMRVRMSDKLQRAVNLAKLRTAEVKDESFEDTLRDFAAYVLLWLARPKTPKE